MTMALIGSGYTQAGIADAIRALGVNCSQPTVSRILRGADPKYALGQAIRHIYYMEGLGDVTCAAMARRIKAEHGLLREGLGNVRWKV